MIGKYQLNFLEKDLQEAFEKRHKNAQRKTNYISGGALLLIQGILAARLIVYSSTSFHVIMISLALSVIALVMNQHAQQVTTALIFVQFILINVQFLTQDYQDFLNSLVSQRVELFLIGLGYGNFSNIVLQSFSKWYVRCLALWLSFILGFLWTPSSFFEKFGQLIPLWTTAVISIFAFYSQERFDKENFYLLFLQNKSLIDWQRIIKDNIPQSMVFVTKSQLKKGNSGAAYSLTHSQQLQQQIRNAAGNRGGVVPGSLERLDKDDCSAGLVFNFVNKKFFDQFKIKEWVEKQRNTINEDGGYLSKPSLTEMLIKGDALKDSMTCSESPLHQILFNNIFKNILVSKDDNMSACDKSQNMSSDSDSENQSKDTMVSLSEYLKVFMDEQKHQNTRTDQTSHNSVGQQKDLTNSLPESQNNSSRQGDPVKVVSCFYRPSTPSFVLDDINAAEVLLQMQQQLPSAVAAAAAATATANNGSPNKGTGPTHADLARLRQIAQHGGGGTFAVLQTESENLMSKGAATSSYMRQASIEKKIMNSVALVTESVKNTNREDTLFTQMISSPRFHTTQDNYQAGSHNTNKGESFLEIDTDRAQDYENVLEPAKPGSETVYNKRGDHELIELEEDDDDDNDIEKQNQVKRGISSEKVSKRAKDEQYQQQDKDILQMQALHLLGESNGSSNNSEMKDRKKASTGNFLKYPSKDTDGNTQHKPSAFKEEQTRQHNQKQQKESAAAHKTNHHQNDNSHSGSSEGDNEMFFDTQMVSCNWGEEEGVLLIMNDVSLRIINEKLREIERFKDQMLSTVTHDLKTPLNSIIMILENSIEMGELNEKQRRIILQNSHLLMSLINDILDYSQIQRDKFRLIIEEVDISQCVLEVVDLFEIQAQQKRIQLCTKFKNLQQSILMQDERRIKQILVNLIGNAMKFTQRDGSIKVVVKQTEPHCLSIAIKDTGTGISDSIQKKLFKFFNTFDHSEKANNRHGIGLGLAICKQLNSQLGPWREIHLQSEENKGSKFTFCLYVNLLNHQDGIEDAQQLNYEGIPNPDSVEIELEAHNNLIMQYGLQQQQLKQQQQQQQSQQRQAATTGVMELADMQQKKVMLIRSATTTDFLQGIRAPQTKDLPNKNSSFTNPQMTATSENIPQAALTSNGMHNVLQHFHPHVHAFRTMYTKASTKLTTPTRSRRSSVHRDSDQGRQISPAAAAAGHHHPATSQIIEIVQSSAKGKDQSTSQMFMKPRNLTRGGQTSMQISAFLKMQESSALAGSNNLRRDRIKDFTVVKGHNEQQQLPSSQKDTSKYMTSLPVLFNSLVPKDKKTLLIKANTFNPGMGEDKKTSIILPQYSPSAPIPSKAYLSSQEIKLDGFNSTIAKKLYEGTVSQTQEMVKQRTLQVSQALGSYGIARMNSINSNLPTQQVLMQHRLQSQKSIRQAPLLNMIESVALTDVEQDQQNSDTPQSKLSGAHKQKGQNTSDMFVAINAKSQMSISDSNQFGLASRGVEESVEDVRSENFKEIEELRKKNKHHHHHHARPAEDLGFPDPIQSENEDETHTKQDSTPKNGNSNPRLLSDKDSSEENQQLQQKQQQQQETINDQQQQQQQQIYHKDSYENQREEAEQTLPEEITQYHQVQQLPKQQQQEEEVSVAVNTAQLDRRLQVTMLKDLLGDYSRAMIADDSPFNIFCLEQILGKNENLSITQAFNGQEALDLYKQHRHQIIFMDLNMPILDGYECMGAIRQFENANHIEERTKVIIVSAQEFEPFFCNFDGFISKPIKLGDIVNTLYAFRQSKLEAAVAAAASALQQ